MIEMKTQQMIKEKIQELSSDFRWAPPINEMTDKAMEFLASGRAKDYHHAVYLAFEDEYQGGAV